MLPGLFLSVTVYARTMQTNGQPLAKPERQQLLTGIVARKRVGTQLELAQALAAAGCPVTQATISRDIRELGLEKTHDALGRPRYEVPLDQGRRRDDPQAALVAVLDAVRAADDRRPEPRRRALGARSAPAIARAIDRTEHPRIVGTLAGDDTCLVITRDEKDARAVAG